ncbi:MAG: hypothetical protein OXG76_12955 [Acidimicrobiaceae bacterium]|nr:hypothetical protein [Acidimicrobiaceae bacterium]
MSDVNQYDEVSITPWFTNRVVDIIIYRINRRPYRQSSLFSDIPESFADHLAETLLFGQAVQLRSRSNREWRLGNRSIDVASSNIAGIIGWQAEEPQTQQYFESELKAWIPRIQVSNQVVAAPFNIDTRNRLLFVVRHNSFGYTAPATVFRTLLQEGEVEREGGPSTDWDVQPILDETDFHSWLEDIYLLRKISFTARLPNPDAEEQFIELDEHMRSMRATTMKHELESNDASSGLSTDLTEDPLTNGLVKMSSRGYADVNASGLDTSGRIRRFTQKIRTRRAALRFTSNSNEAARDELMRFCNERRELDDG